VTHSSLLRLKPAQWLDDEIMNFYGTMLQHRSEGEMEGLGLDQGSGRRVYYCNSFFYTKLSQQGYEAAKLRRWTKKVIPGQSLGQADADAFCGDRSTFSTWTS